MQRSNEITLESIKDKSYEEMSREEKQFFCEHAHLLNKNPEDDGIIMVDDIDAYKRQRDLIDLETAKEIIMDAVLPLCK